MNNLAPFGFADFANPKTIIALVLAVFAIVFLFLSKRFAKAVFCKKYPDKSYDDEEYQEKFLSITLVFKSIATAIAVCACVLAIL